MASSNLILCADATSWTQGTKLWATKSTQGQGKGAFSAVEDAPVGELRAEHRLPSPRLEDMSRSQAKSVMLLFINRRAAQTEWTPGGPGEDVSTRRKTQRSPYSPASAHYKSKFATSRLVAVDSYFVIVLDDMAPATVSTVINKLN